MIIKMILFQMIFSFSTVLLANDIQGTYTQPCQTIDADTIQQSLNFTGTDLAKTIKKQASQTKLAWEIQAFEDEKCQISYLKISRKFDVVSLSSQSITVKTIQVTYTAISEEVAESMNFINYCGYSDWAIGQVKDVTGHICDDYQQLKNNELKQYSLIARPNELSWDNDITPYIRSHVSKMVTHQ